ncbi:arylformamidase [Bacillus taeanensis]|uniref:Kynurenine formamidase n=1 Tax=Bacillus taeanensis TaxID=273032 RepID=A0A366XVR9_9BACI|nr:arylformamidase [Bacillus taeanensis]RBW69245.1 arylformamidase [Bacillus taeanensis]
MWIDISQPLNNDIAVWPGDTPFSYEVAYSKKESGSVNVGKLEMSTHTGTHIDAPFHFDDHGKKVLDLDINIYVGKAKIIDVSQYESIGEVELQSYQLEGVKRLLLKTNASMNPYQFPEKIPHLRQDLAPYLKKMGVRLVGVDVPSVDPLDSKELKAHHALFNNGIHILENVVLSHVTPGDYKLIALPLALKDSDGSPVRAVVKAVK